MKSQPGASQSGEPHQGLLGRGYLSLLATQFLGAANDNILKQCLTFMVATGIWSGSFSEGGLGQGGQVVPGLLLTIPFIFLSGYAGQVADRFSKRRVMVWVKVAEVPIAMLAAFGFITHDLWLTLFSLLLLSVQSSFFGPAKYGVIPELVAEQHLSMANGLINMSTNLAVIIGSLAAGPLSDMFDPEEGEAVSAAPGLALVAVALAGVVAIYGMPKLSPVKPDLKYDLNPFSTYIESLVEMSKSSLLGITLAWSGFYMVGMMALMIIPEYKDILEIDYKQTSYFLGLLGIAIAIGSVSAGVISGKRIRPSLIPIGASGMAASFLVLGLLQPTRGNVSLFIFSAGLSAGLYIVPLQALIQHLSPDDERGRFLGTANALSFCFSTFGLVIYWLAVKEMPPNRVHLICAAFAVVGTIMGTRRLRKVGDKILQPTH